MCQDIISVQIYCRWLEFRQSVECGGAASDEPIKSTSQCRFHSLHQIDLQPATFNNTCWIALQPKHVSIQIPRKWRVIVCMLRNFRRVLWVSQSPIFYLQARFPASQPALFKHLSSDSLLRVRVFDGEPAGVLCLSSGRLKPKRLLGEMTFSVSHIEVIPKTSGVYPGSLMVIAKRNRTWTYLQLPY